MSLDISSTTAFAPPPPAVLYEPTERWGVGSTPEARPRRVGLPKPITSSATAKIEELPLQTASETSAKDVPKYVVLGQHEPLATEISKRAHMAIEISKRLQFLKVEAEIDGVPFSQTSLADFRAFMREIGPRTKPSLFLNDNGNLRALWKNDKREQVGLQFLGEGNIQFVIFKQRKGILTMARVAGLDSSDRILGHIKASGAEGLLFG